MREPKVVLHLIDCLAPGGSEKQLLYLLRSTDRQRFRLLVGVFHRGGGMRQEVEALGVPIYDFPLVRSLGHPNTAWQLARIVATCVRERVAIVHAHDFYSNVLGVIAGKLAGARVLVSRGDLAHWLRPIQRRALGLACRRADRVVANAHAVAAVDICELATPPKLVRVVPNGIDIDAFDRESPLVPDPPVPELDRGEPVLLYVANMNTRAKGHADLIDALALLSERGARPRMLLVGAGSERPRLEAYARERGLGERVRFLGQRKDVPRLLSRVSAACSPSWAEGLPNAVLEAMLAARPVVATRVGGCPEIIADGESGLLIEPRDPFAFARALERVLTAPEEARRLGERARRAVVARHGLDRFGNAYEQLYAELTASLGERALVLAS